MAFHELIYLPYDHCPSLSRQAKEREDMLTRLVRSLYLFDHAFGFSEGKAKVITVDPEDVDDWSYSYINKTGIIVDP